MSATPQASTPAPAAVAAAPAATPVMPTYIAIRKSDSLTAPAMFTQRKDCAHYLAEPTVEYIESTDMMAVMNFLAGNAMSPPAQTSAKPPATPAPAATPVAIPVATPAAASVAPTTPQPRPAVPPTATATATSQPAAVGTRKRPASDAAPAASAVAAAAAVEDSSAQPKAKRAKNATTGPIAERTNKTTISTETMAAIAALTELRPQTPPGTDPKPKMVGGYTMQPNTDSEADDGNAGGMMLAGNDSTDEEDNADAPQTQPPVVVPPSLATAAATAAVAATTATIVNNSLATAPPPATAAAVATAVATTTPAATAATALTSIATPQPGRKTATRKTRSRPKPQPPTPGLEAAVAASVAATAARFAEGALLGATSDNAKTPSSRKRRPREKKKGMGQKALGFKTFDQLFEELKAFKEENGHTNVPFKPTTPLKNFCSEVRREFRDELPKGTAVLLNYERVKKLTNLGFNLTVKKKTEFNQQAVRWLEFHTEHGRNPTPKENPEMYKWVEYTREIYQRSKLRNHAPPKRGRPSQLTPEWIERLEEWGFKWEVANRKRGVAKFGGKSFDVLFDLLSKFKQKHGHVLVQFKQDKLLHRFCMEMRREYEQDFHRGKAKYLDMENIQKLTSLGFSFATKKRTPFEQHAMAWLDYFNKHGHDPKNKDGSLYEWVRTVRAAYQRMEERGTLPPPPADDGDDAMMETAVEKAIDEHNQDEQGADSHDDTDIPERLFGQEATVDENGNTSGDDNNNASNNGGGNSAEPNDATPSPNSPDNNGTDEAAATATPTGTVAAAATATEDDADNAGGSGVKQWKRGRQSNLTPNWLHTLTKWGFSFYPREPKPVKVKCRPWDERYQQLMEFKRQNNHCLVPKRYPVLGNWVCSQRKQARFLREGKPTRLTAERLDLLIRAGFVFNTKKEFDMGASLNRDTPNAGTPMAGVPTPTLAAAPNSYPNTRGHAHREGRQYTLPMAAARGRQMYTMPPAADGVNLPGGFQGSVAAASVTPQALFRGTGAQGQGLPPSGGDDHRPPYVVGVGAGVTNTGDSAAGANSPSQHVNGNFADAAGALQHRMPRVS